MFSNSSYLPPGMQLIFHEETLPSGKAYRRSRRPTFPCVNRSMRRCLACRFSFPYTLAIIHIKRKELPDVQFLIPLIVSRSLLPHAEQGAPLRSDISRHQHAAVDFTLFTRQSPANMTHTPSFWAVPVTLRNSQRKQHHHCIIIFRFMIVILPVICYNQFMT